MRYGITVGQILHPTDFSHGSQIAFAHALRLAVAAQGSLSILHVDKERRPPNWSKYPSVRDQLAVWGMLPEEASRTDVVHLGVSISKASVGGETPADGVLQYLEKHPADLIVMATHQRHGIDRWLHETVAGKVNSRTDGATLFIPFGITGFVDEASGKCSLRRILLPVDDLPDPQPAIEIVCDLVRTLCDDVCEVDLLYVGDPANQHALPLPNEQKIRWKWLSRVGGVVEVILQVAEEEKADLIVMTTSGRHGFLDALRGSTTEQVLEHARCPIMAVHEERDE